MRDYMGLLRVIEEEKSAMYAVRLNPVAHSALLYQYRARYRALRVSFCCLRFVVDFASTTGLPWPTCQTPTARSEENRTSAGYWRTTM